MISDARRILLVCDQAETIELILKQALAESSHHVRLVRSISQAIQELSSYIPHLILCSLSLSDLSAKDLLIALSAQSLDIPLILLAEKGQENNLLQALRLGASDFILLPAKETEILGVIERNLARSQLAEEYHRLQQELSKTLMELQERTRLVSFMRQVTKVLTASSSQNAKIDTLLKEALSFCKADLGWIMRFHSASRSYLLEAAVNLPYGSHILLGKAWDDGVSKSVIQKGTALLLHGAAVRKLPIGRFGEALLAIPIKARRMEYGAITIMRKTSHPFTEADRNLIDIVGEVISALWWSTTF